MLKTWFSRCQQYQIVRKNQTVDPTTSNSNTFTNFAPCSHDYAWLTHVHEGVFCTFNKTLCRSTGNARYIFIDSWQLTLQSKVVYLKQLCPTKMSYWVKNSITIFMRAMHCFTYLHFSKLESYWKHSNNNFNCNDCMVLLSVQNCDVMGKFSANGTTGYATFQSGRFGRGRFGHGTFWSGRFGVGIFRKRHFCT